MSFYYYGSSFQYEARGRSQQQWGYHQPGTAQHLENSARGFHQGVSSPFARPFTGQSAPENFQGGQFQGLYAERSSSRSIRTMSASRMMSSSSADFSDGTAPIRNWEHTGLGSMLNEKMNDPTLLGGGVRFTIMCYNILADGLMKKHKELYKRCEPGNLEWNFRVALFFQEIDQYAPDVICMQEVEESEYQLTFEPRFNARGFKGAYKRKTGTDKFDGCAIFYRTSKFHLVEKLGVELFQPHIPLLNRDNIGLLVKLETRNSVRKQRLVVGTTHLLFNEKRQDVKLAQSQLLLAELDRFAFSGFDREGNCQYHPILMTGDFNSKPFSPVTKLFSEGRLPYLDENGEILKLLRRRGMNSLIPPHSGISDQCQHYKIILERYKQWRASGTNYVQVSSKRQEALVNLFPYLEARGYIRSVKESESSTMTASNPPEEENILALLSPQEDCTNEASVIEMDDTDKNLSGVVQEKVAMQVNKSRANIMEVSASSSQEQLLFPERQPQLEEHILEEVTRCGIACHFASGALSHRFNFRDIYSSRLDGKSRDKDGGVTSKSGGWTCVDYIYQSMTWHSTFNKMIEGKLKLVRRLGLFTRNDCKNIAIPSEEHPSDHFPLVAEFLLRP